MKHTFLIVGASFKTFTEYMERHDMEYLLLKDIRLTKYPHKKFKRRQVCDFSNPEAMLQTVGALAKKHRFDGVIATYEHYILPAAQIAAHLGLPGLPVEVAQACTDKFLMRRKFAAAPEKISPDFAVVRSEADIRSFAASHDFPLILKPANLSKSLLVTKNHTLEELLENYQKTLSNIEAVYAKYAPGVTPKMLVEEFMAGPVHSVDAFVDAKGEPHVLDAVVDYQTGYEIGYDDNFHYSRLLPSKLAPEDIADIRHVAALGCRALGMKNTPAHIEIIRTKQGPRIVEIGARNGGYRERMHRLANGIDIVDNALRIAMGKPVAIQADRNESIAVLELFPKQPGLFAGIAHENELARLPSLTYYSVKAQPDTFVGKSSDGFKMCAIVILHNKDAAQFNRDLSFVNQHVHVQTKPVG